jgi:protein O-mannosyl-transferase
MLTKKHILLIYLLLTAVSITAFWQLNHCDFINYDDPTYVTENIHIRNGVTTEAIRWVCTAGYAANWHPLTWMSHMLDVQLFGLNPRWHHLTNLLFHIANTLLLFFVFHRMTKETWKSAFVAALFALHPLHVQSVAWVSERKDVLSTFFWMLTMGAYIHYVEHPRLKNYLAVLIFFALGLMAKPMLVTLPFVLLLLDYWPLQRVGLNFATPPNSATAPFLFAALHGRTTIRLRVKKLLLEKLPLFAFAALSCIVTYVVQKKGGSVASFEVFPLGIRIANAFVSYIVYIAKMVWPDNLAVFYPHPGLWPLWQVLGAVFFLAAASLIVMRTANRFPYLTVGWLWFLGTIVPVMGIVQVGGQAMADRYTYIPLIGLFIMSAWGIPELLKKWRYRKEALFASSALILACLFVVTWTQVGYWRNSIILYDHALKVTSRNDTIHNNRGDAFCRLGNLRQAIPDFDKAVGINPENADAYYNRGVTYGKLGDNRRAIEDFDRSIEINPKRVEPYYNRGFAYGELGDQGQAIENFSMAIEIAPENADAYNSRGVSYGKLGNYRQAISDYDRTVEIDPGHARAFNNRGFAYDRLGDHRQAISDYNRAIEIKPDYAKAYFNRGIAHVELGDDSTAIEDLKTAAEFDSKEAKEFLRSRGIN